jgi:Fe-S oxidoreductase
MAGEWVAALNAFRPKKVACTCGSCCYEARNVFPAFADVSFQSMHVSKLLADEIHRLEFDKSVEAKITVHDPCYMSRKIGDVESVRKLLGAVPGVTLVEMAHNKENALCCGIMAQNSYPNIAAKFQRQILDEAKETGAQILATTCIGCHRVFCRYQGDYPFEVKHFINLLAEAAGLSYEDKLKKYQQLGTIDAIIDESREYIEASPYSLEEYKQLLPLYFSFPEP